ncbi:MAG: 2-keto-4-pentenoate hydratase [Gemmobacter sp.]
MQATPATPEAHAALILAVQAEGRQIAPLSDADPGFDLPAARRVAHAVSAARRARGERMVGRKIGFTNVTIWDEYGVHAPIWGPVWDSTLHPADRPLPLAPLIEPRIEPEIILRLGRAPEPGMGPEALMGCIEAVAHGFEIVQSLYPGWRFRAADTVAAFALHGALVTGPFVPVPDDARARWAEELGAFGIELWCDGALMDAGAARNVLGGGPMAALAHLVAELAADPLAPPLAAGEIVSTGTLTRALPVAAGERWSTRLAGLSLPDFALGFA